MRSKLLLSILLLSIAGCSYITAISMEKKYGTPHPQPRETASVTPQKTDYWTDIKPIFDGRCIVCHACYDAPCQLKLTAPEGLDRGATKNRVYHPERLVKADLTRLFEDATTTEQWRAKEFFPVLNEYPNEKANHEASLLYQMLTLKKHNPLPEGAQLPEDFTLGIQRDQTCPSIEEFAMFAADNPLWGMPYGFPGVSEEEFNTVENWLAEGAQYSKRPPLSESINTAIANWEGFLNQDSLKMQLSARYIYEHLFIAHLYFDDIESGDQKYYQYFKLVRSTTPPGQKVDRIATRRPYDDPAVERVYYRIVPDYETTVVKTHLPYALNSQRMTFWTDIFQNADYEVAQLPTFENKITGNPFRAFRDLPVNTRYRFLLEEAQFSIMNFIKGPVCRGQTALNVIRDQFWVFFVSPNSANDELVAEFLEENLDKLEMPSVQGSTFRPLTNWIKYSSKQKALMEAQDKYLADKAKQGLAVDLNTVWDGDGKNPNAALTIFRNFDSATVEKGLLGAPPQTAWLISYPLLERIHYLLVAGYDVYGNISHQLLSRLYMDFLRMSGESTFLLMLPEDARNSERKNWYREADNETMAYLTHPSLENHIKPAINYRTDNPKLELYGYLKHRLRHSLSSAHDIAAVADTDVRVQLKRLARFEGKNTRFLPDLTVINIDTKNGPVLTTLIKNTAHLNVTSMFGEYRNIIEKENTVTVTKGIVGSYPNIFMRVEKAELPELVTQLTTMRSEADYRRVLDSYGVRRTAENFWQFSDKVHRTFNQQQPLEFGYLDYNRYENR